MKNFILLFVSITALVFTSCKTQQDPASVATKKAVEEQQFRSAEQALINRDFVLEADRITFRNGNLTFVTPNTNFISMKGDKATIQLAFSSPYAGPNGIGGITVDGNASNVKMKTDKKGNIYYSMSVQGIGVSATVSFTISKGTNQCSATVSPNFNNRIITFMGNVYPSSESNVFKGRAL